MKLVIAGSRNLDPSTYLIGLEVSNTEALFGFKFTEVITGLAKGPDRNGQRWAVMKGIPVTEFPADWDRHGRAAGPIRNGLMAEACDALLAFWDCESRGTEDMILRALRAGKRVRVVTCPHRETE